MALIVEEGRIRLEVDKKFHLYYKIRTSCHNQTLNVYKNEFKDQQHFTSEYYITNRQKEEKGMKKKLNTQKKVFQMNLGLASI